MKRFNLSKLSSKENDDKEDSSLTSSLRKISLLSKSSNAIISTTNESSQHESKRFIGNFSTGIFGSSTANDNKTKQAKQLKIILSLLEDVKLQCPDYHSGLVVAVSSAISAPLTYEGIRFTWYRLGNNTGDQFHTVDESSKAWYAPTVDDIGCKICVQCEDSYQQGFSRYVECGPIEADPLLVTLTENILSNNYYECQDTSVSLGLNEIENYESVNNEITTIQDRMSILQNNQSFLQLDGRSSIIVDSQGLFISIPVKIQEKKLHQSSRGLRINPSSNITVKCIQPASLLLDLPIRELTQLRSTGTDGSMEKFLGSSTLKIPWSYEGVHSPEALSLSTEGNASVAEEDAIAFATIVCNLTELVSSMPESTQSMKICIACSDRMSRDLLVCSIRLLLTSPMGSTNIERRQTFTWLDNQVDSEVGNDIDNEVDNLVDNKINKKKDRKSNGLKELQHRIRALEEENTSLKKDRNELTSQLMQQREVLVSRKKSKSKKTEAEADDHIDIKSSNEKDGNVDEEEFNNNENDKVDEEIEKDEESDEEIFDHRQLLSEIIELENKLKKANKRESDLLQRYSELEIRNNQIQSQNDLLSNQSNDLSIQFTILKHEKELTDKKIQNLQNKIEKLENQLNNLNQLNIDAEELQSTLSYRENEFDKLKQDYDKISNELLIMTEMFDTLNDRCKKYEEEMKNNNNEFNEYILRLEQQVSIKDEIINDLNKQVKDLSNVQQLKQDEIDRLALKTVELEKAETKIQKLQGEINHLYQKTESQLKENKKQIKENNYIIEEYEKALVRKSDECNALQALVRALEEEIKNYQSIDSYMGQIESNSNQRFFSLPIQLPIKIDPLLNIISRNENKESNDNIEENSIDKSVDSSQQQSNGITSFLRRPSMSQNSEETSQGLTSFLRRPSMSQNTEDDTSSLQSQGFASFLRRPSVSQNTEEESNASSSSGFTSFLRRPSVSHVSNDEVNETEENSSPSAITSAANTAKNFIQRFTMASTNIPSSPTSTSKSATTTTTSTPNISPGNINTDPALQGEHLTARLGRYSQV